MVIERTKQIQFLKDALRAEQEDFKKKALTQAISLLTETEEMYVGQFIAFRDGELLMKFPNTRNLPRNGEHLLCLLLPNELQDYRNWGERTYLELFDKRHDESEAVCVWHSPSDDPRFNLVGFRGVEIAFSNVIQKHPRAILVFGPQKPPLDYFNNLIRITEDYSSAAVATVLDADYAPHDWSPNYIKNANVASFIKHQSSLINTIILQGPPGTGKTYMIADLCQRLCAEGKSVLVTALTNKALTEVAEKDFLSSMLSEGRVLKTNLTVDEQIANPNLQLLKQIAPMPSCVVLSTYYITSGYAADVCEDQLFDVVIMDEASQALFAMFAASKKIGKSCIWVGDVKQLPPIVKLNEDRISAFGYQLLVNGFALLTSSSENPIYQLTDAYRFGSRAAHYTGIFYQDTLESKANQQTMLVPADLQRVLHRRGGPGLIMANLPLGDDAPSLAIKLATALVYLLIKHDAKKKISVLSCKIRTTKALQKSIIQQVGARKNIMIETIAKIQGETSDVTIFVIPNASYYWNLNPNLFNVATSRAREHTIIIADQNIMQYGSMDSRVRSYLSEVRSEQYVYVENDNDELTQLM